MGGRGGEGQGIRARAASLAPPDPKWSSGRTARTHNTTRDGLFTFYFLLLLLLSAIDTQNEYNGGVLVTMVLGVRYPYAVIVYTKQIGCALCKADDDDDDDFRVFSPRPSAHAKRDKAHPRPGDRCPKPGVLRRIHKRNNISLVPPSCPPPPNVKVLSVSETVCLSGKISSHNCIPFSVAS